MHPRTAALDSLLESASEATAAAHNARGESTADDATNAAVRHLVNAVSALRNVVELTLQPSAPDDQHGTCTRWVLGIGVHAGDVQITADDGHVTTITVDKFADLARGWLAGVGMVAMPDPEARSAVLRPAAALARGWLAGVGMVVTDDPEHVRTLPAHRAGALAALDEVRGRVHHIDGWWRAVADVRADIEAGRWPA